MIDSVRHERPTNLADALAALAGGGTPYVGGTELIAAMRLGLLAPEHLVDLKGLPELNGVHVAGSVVHIGSATSHAVAEQHAEVRERLPALSSALHSIGNPRVRWQGTLGGNLCFAEPRSDLVPVLVALGATLLLRSERGERTVQAADFVTDAFTVDRADDELLMRISIDTDGLAYQQYDRVQYMERPSIGVAVVQRDGRWRMCVGAVGYVPYLAVAASLDELDPSLVAAALEPIEDAAGSAEYKRSLAEVTIARSLAVARVLP